MKFNVRSLLTKTVVLHGKRVKVPPNDNLVYAVYFSLGMVGCLTVLEAVHLIVLGVWNSEIFTVISGLVGNVTGIFLSQRS